MEVTVLRTNSGECPRWGVRVSVRGWYGKQEDGSWRFLRAECPIIENAKKPRYEQDAEYRMMRCQDRYSCPFYTEFQPSTTSDI